MRRQTATLLPIAAALVAALATSPGLEATNGMYLTGYGPETLGRGGANLAVSDRVLALNFNPAGIAQLQGHHLSYSLSLLAPGLDNENLINAPTDAESRYFPLPAVAYVRGGKDTPWTWGIGFLAQGGMGATFERYDTFFGTRDETFSEVRFMTASPTVAYSLTGDMAVGATLHLGYADASFRLFPDTSFFDRSDPANSFFGVGLDRAGGLQTSVRLGWWWRPRPRLSVGAVYQTETESEFTGGDLLIDFTSHPFLGRKIAYSADVDGFTFAAQAGAGLAFRPGDRWILALDVKRYFWDDAIDTIVVTATHPRIAGPPAAGAPAAGTPAAGTPAAGAPAEVILPFVFDWRDQWVLAAGIDYRASDRWTLRAGYNFGENPVPDATLTPLFPANVEHHLSFGLAWLKGSRTFEIALEHAFANDQVNDNTDPRVNPFGPGLRVGHAQWTLSFGISRAWSRRN